MIQEVAKMLVAIMNSKFIYIIGNGGSASTANHFANDLVKMCGLKAVSLCANEAVVMAYANDDGYENIFVNQLKVFLTKDDLLITISGSGTSPNILKAISYAQKKGANVLSFPTLTDYACTMAEIEDIHLKLAHKLATSLSLTLA
jgi:D-sedoheptulose 7-phosphate isomerase